MIIIDKSNNIPNFDNVSDIAVQQADDKYFYISCRLNSGEIYPLGKYTTQEEVDKGRNKIIKAYKFRRRVVKL